MRPSWPAAERRVRRSPSSIHGREVHLSASVGITRRARRRPHRRRRCCKNAELAMYRAKKSGRDALPLLRRRDERRGAPRGDAWSASCARRSAAEQFVVHYQPQLNLGPGALVGVEALVRWNHPASRPGPAGRVHRPGRGYRADRADRRAWVLRSACRQQRAGATRARRPADVGQPVAGPVPRARRRAAVERVLAESGSPPSALDLELTENAVIENSQTAIQSLRHLNQLGVASRSTISAPATRRSPTSSGCRCSG